MSARRAAWIASALLAAAGVEAQASDDAERLGAVRAAFLAGDLVAVERGVRGSDARGSDAQGS
ncbi:hypothetical protein L6R52_42895, partial [Myxococcota bacterium]|nr:hypothetical protein [Myxococcota bacterium]